MKFLSRRQSSKSKQNDSDATDATAANTPPKSSFMDMLKVGSIEEPIATEAEAEESRDDSTPIENFFTDAGSVLSTAFAEAVGMADDIKTIISADIDDYDDDVYDDFDVPVSSKKVVKGSHSDLAKEIKKLGKQDERKEKAKKQIKKCEDEIVVVEAERVETLKKIKALSQKFKLHNDNVDHDDERDEERYEA